MLTRAGESKAMRAKRDDAKAAEWFALTQEERDARDKADHAARLAALTAKRGRR